MNVNCRRNNMDILKDTLPSRLFEVIEKAGISTPKQIITLSFWDIKKLTNLKNEDIMMIKNIVTQYVCPLNFTGDKISEEVNKVQTGCTSIDAILHGGFRRGTLTEIYGESGTGKTQVVMQVAAHCGEDGSVFICTEDLFPVKRYNQIRQNICSTQSGQFVGHNNMFIEHITEAQELMSCIRVRLSKLLNTNKITVIILDSVAAPFRCEYTNYVQRAEELKELGMLLYKVAQEFNVAVICINQVTSIFADNSANVLPTLGLVWSNMVCYKMKIYKTSAAWHTKRCNQDILREFKIVHAPDLPIASAKFIITAYGVENA